MCVLKIVLVNKRTYWRHPRQWVQHMTRQNSTPLHSPFGFIVFLILLSFCSLLFMSTVSFTPSKRPAFPNHTFHFHFTSTIDVTTNRLLWLPANRSFLVWACNGNLINRAWSVCMEVSQPLSWEHTALPLFGTPDLFEDFLIQT